MWWENVFLCQTFNWPNKIHFIQIYWKFSVDLQRTWRNSAWCWDQFEQSPPSEDKDMYNNVKRTRRKNGNMNTSEHFKKTQSQPQKQNKKVNIGDVIMIKSESKNKGHWKIGKISQLYTGKDKWWEQLKCKLWQSFWFDQFSYLTH